MKLSPNSSMKLSLDYSPTAKTKACTRFKNVEARLGHRLPPSQGVSFIPFDQLSCSPSQYCIDHLLRSKPF